MSFDDMWNFGKPVVRRKESPNVLPNLMALAEGVNVSGKKKNPSINKSLLAKFDAQMSPQSVTTFGHAVPAAPIPKSLVPPCPGAVSPGKDDRHFLSAFASLKASSPISSPSIKPAPAPVPDARAGDRLDNEPPACIRDNPFMRRDSSSCSAASAASPSKQARWPSWEAAEERAEAAKAAAARERARSNLQAHAAALAEAAPEPERSPERLPNPAVEPEPEPVAPGAPVARAEADDPTPAAAPHEASADWDTEWAAPASPQHEHELSPQSRADAAHRADLAKMGAEVEAAAVAAEQEEAAAPPNPLPAELAAAPALDKKKSSGLSTRLKGLFSRPPSAKA